MTHCRRIVMLLSGDWSFAPSLRAPAISRLQKIHNVELVFRQLTQRGFDLKTPKGKCCLFPWQLAYWLPFAVLLLALGAVAVLAMLWHPKFCSVIVLGFKLTLSSLFRIWHYFPLFLCSYMHNSPFIPGFS